MFRASSLLSTSTTIHALWTSSQQPKSACVKKWEPDSRRTLAARAHATTSDSCGTSMRNLGMLAVSCWPSEKSTRYQYRTHDLADARAGGRFSVQLGDGRVDPDHSQGHRAISHHLPGL